MKKRFFVISLFVLLALFVSCATTTETTPAKPASSSSNETGTVRGRVVVEDCDPTICGIIVVNKDTNVRYRTVTDLTGTFNIVLPVGNYSLTFERGPEYSEETIEITVKKNIFTKLETVVLEHPVDMYSENWIAGDLHMHTFYSDGANSVSDQLLGNVSKGLYFGFLTDHNTFEGVKEWITGNNLVVYEDNDETRKFHAFEGLEITTQYGHFQTLGKPVYYDDAFVNISKELKAKEGTAEYDNEIRSRILDIAEKVEAECGIAQINHPYSVRDMGFHYWDLADNFDTIEIWNGVFCPCDDRFETSFDTAEQNYKSKIKWFELLNEVKNGGKFYAATCGTDNHHTDGRYSFKTNYDLTTVDNLEEYVELYNRNGVDDGVPTIYVYCEGSISLNKILDSIKKGHSFLTNGITVLSDVNGSIFGDTVRISPNMKLNLSLYCHDGLEKIQIVKNGELYKEIKLDGYPTSYQLQMALDDIKAGDWIVLEICGFETNYAITNPYFFK